MLRLPRALKFPSLNNSVKFFCLNCRLVIIYWILSGPKAGRASAQHIWKQGRKRRLWRNAITFSNMSKKVYARGGVSSKSLCSRWVRTQGAMQGKAGFPQTTRVMQYQISAVLHRGTMGIFHPKMNPPERWLHAYLGDMSTAFLVWNLTCLCPGVYGKQALLWRLTNIPN